MSKLIDNKKKWVPLEIALSDSNVHIKTIKQIYVLIKKRKLHNGFVIKKKADSNRWGWFCYEDYQKWQGI